MSRAVMQKALEALDSWSWDWYGPNLTLFPDAILALRAELAKHDPTSYERNGLIDSCLKESENQDVPNGTRHLLARCAEMLERSRAA